MSLSDNPSSSSPVAGSNPTLRRIRAAADDAIALADLPEPDSQRAQRLTGIDVKFMPRTAFSARHLSGTQRSGWPREQVTHCAPSAAAGTGIQRVAQPSPVRLGAQDVSTSTRAGNGRPTERVAEVGAVLDQRAQRYVGRLYPQSQEAQSVSSIMAAPTFSAVSMMRKRHIGRCAG